jgi:hypothetical protein
MFLIDRIFVGKLSVTFFLPSRNGISAIAAAGEVMLSITPDNN